MNFDNPLHAVYDAFRVSHESLNAAKLAVLNQHKAIGPRIEFGGASWEDAETALQQAEQQSSDLAVFALFVTFERYVIEHLQTTHVRLAAGHRTGYSRKLAEKFRTEVEYWRFDEILDLFKPELNADLIGRVKQIKKYRDWIAHRNTSKPAPPRATPEEAFNLLSAVAGQIGQLHAGSGRRRETLPVRVDPLTFAAPHGWFAHGLT